MNWRTPSRVAAFIAACAVGVSCAHGVQPFAGRPTVARSRFAPVNVADPPAPPRYRPGIGAMVGRIRIPAIDMSIGIRQGCGLAVLARGVCHYAGGAWPGERGTVALAGHDVTPVGPWDHGPFRYIDQLRPGDMVVIVFHHQRFVYAVQSTRVVLPSNTDVLHHGDLVMTACYPPGSASYRIAVEAAWVGRGADAVGRSRPNS